MKEELDKYIAFIEKRENVEIAHLKHVIQVWKKRYHDLKKRL